MIENEKYLTKILVIGENEPIGENTTRVIQELIRDPSTIKEEHLIKHDIPNIFYSKKRQKFELVSSKIIKDHKNLPGKCLKLVNTELIVWKHPQNQEYVILLLQNDDSILSNEKQTYTVHLNVCKNSAKHIIPKKCRRLVKYRRNYRRNVIRSSAKKISNRIIKNRLKLNQNKKILKVEQKLTKPRLINNTKNLNRFLQNSIEIQMNSIEKYVTAILDVENVKRDDNIAKIFITRDVKTKHDINKFVNIIKNTDTSIICDKFKYIRQEIKKNIISVEDIKSVAFISKKSIKMYIQNESKLLKKLPCNSVSKSIKMNGVQFISVQSMNFKLKNIKLCTIKNRPTSKNIQKIDWNDVAVEIEDIDGESKSEKTILDSNNVENNSSFTSTQTNHIKSSDLPVNLVKKTQVQISNVAILKTCHSTEELNEKLKYDTGIIKSSKCGNNDLKKSSNDSKNPVKMVISGENVLKQTSSGSKPNIKTMKVSKEPTIVNKDVVLSQIQDSLKLVTERLAKNTRIIKEIVGKSNDILVKGFKNPFLKEEIELLENDSQHMYPKNKDTNISRDKTKRYSQMSLYSRATGSICSSKTLQDIGQSSFKQNQYFHKAKYDKDLITVIPIKNFIVDNKRKVSSNAVREKKPEKRSKSSQCAKPILPVISSQYFCLKKPVTKLELKSKVFGKNDKIKPLIQTVRETPLQIKTVRPVPRVLETCQSLSKLTLKDLVPLQSEYPRKDHLTEFSEENIYVCNVFHNSHVSKYLEPLIECGDKRCESCKNLTDTKLTSKQDGLSKMSNKNIGLDKYAPKNNSFDFKRYITLSEMSCRSNYTLYPVAVVQMAPRIAVNRKMENMTAHPVPKRAVPVSNTNTTKNMEPRPKKISTVSNNAKLDNKIIKKVPNFGSQNQSKIEKIIQQTIRKNNNHQKIVEEISKTVWQNKNSSNTKTPNKNILNSKEPVDNFKYGTRNVVPKFTPKKSNIQHTSTRMVPNKSNVVTSTKIGNVNKKLPIREILFNKKYKKTPPIVCDKLSKITSNPIIDGKDLQQKELPKVTENSQDNIQKYLQLIELKFLKTFTLPEDQKVNAYNILAQEINDMLQVLSSDNAKEKQLKIMESLERLTNIPNKTSSDEIVSHSKQSFKCTSNSLINLTLSMKTLETTSVEVNKEIVTQTSRSTVCSESISFMESLSAIMSKQSQLFPVLSQTNSENTINPVSILKASNSGKIYIPKTVRFGPQDPRILKSDVSVSYSSGDDDDYMTIHEEDLIEFNSKDVVSSISVECSSLIDLKTDISYAFVEHLVEITYIFSIFDEVSILNKDTFLLNYSMLESYDTVFLEPTDLDIRIKNFDMFCSESNNNSTSNISFATSSGNSKCIYSDKSNTNLDSESSNYIPVETKTSPNIIEFLDIMVNLSFETIPYREAIFYKTIISYIHTEYEASITCTINFFHSIELHVSNNIQQLVPKLGKQSKQLCNLVDNSRFDIFPRLMSARSLRLKRKVFMENFDNLYDLQEDNCFSLVNLRTSRSLELTSPVTNVNNQTMVVNVHIEKDQLEEMVPIRTNKRYLEKTQMNQKIADVSFQENTTEVDQHRNNYKLILIFLYITIFSTIIFCTFLNNYTCE